MGIENQITPLDREPVGANAKYLIRISVYNGRGGYEGPFQVDKDPRAIDFRGQTRVVLPLNGPACDLKGIGIFGFTTPRTGMYAVTKQLVESSFAPDLVKWQVFSSPKDELKPDPEGWKGAFMAKRIWVCFSGCEVDAWRYYHNADFIQATKGYLRK